MATVTIGNLNAVAGLDDTGLFAIEQSGVTVKGTLAVVRTALNAGDVAVGGALSAATVEITDEYTVGGAPGDAGTVTTIVKKITGMTDATATDVLTVTIPNAAHAASIRVQVCGSLGAGGAVGANESTATNAYNISIARVAGVAAVRNQSSAFGPIAIQSAGAATLSAVMTTSGMTGAAGATQTFTIRVTVTKGSGSSDNHSAVVLAEVLNFNASGVTLS